MMGGLGMGFIWIVLVALFLVVILLAIGDRGKHNLKGQNESSEQPVLDFLKMQYARGEIDREKFIKKSKPFCNKNVLRKEMA